MSEKQMLKLVGYWNGPRAASEWAHPSAFVSANWRTETKRQIIEYLRSGIRIHEDLGFSQCRFIGGPPDREMGNAELTDGVWIWPEGLAVYVERFGVTLPDEFVDHMIENDFAIASDLDSEALEETPVDFSFWRRWCAAHMNL